MDVSIRDIFSRRDITRLAGRNDSEYISLRNSLSNHYRGLESGLRNACTRFITHNKGSGYARGCSHKGEGLKGELFHVIPAWVPVDDHEIRTIEGIVTMSKITRTDFPLRPWHKYYDWLVWIRPDKQHTYLLGEYNRDSQEDHRGEIECEWDTGDLQFTTSPYWIFPQDGVRVWMVGRWIYDCGHPSNNIHKTEIHPPKAIATFRTEGINLPGNNGHTRANNAILYISRFGGYWQYPAINDQNYEFDLYIPPRPYESSVPKWKVEPIRGVYEDSLPLLVQPVITPYPKDNPKALRVLIPLKGISPAPREYGAVISGGWSDPAGTESGKIKPVVVNIKKIYMDHGHDHSGDEWHVYVGINGRWKYYPSLSGYEKSLGLSVDLYLHPEDKIHITACGFEADMLHNHMGQRVSKLDLTWEKISNPNLTDHDRSAIADALFWQLARSLKDENDTIGYLSLFHDSKDRGTFTKRANKITGDYRIEYEIREIIRGSPPKGP